MDRLIHLVCAIFLLQSVACGPLLNSTDERDTNFLINKIKDSIAEVLEKSAEVKPIEVKAVEKEENKPIGPERQPAEPEGQHDNNDHQVLFDEHEKSKEIVHFNSKGESIENEKTKIKAGVACKAPANELPKKQASQPKQVHHVEHNALHSSSVEEHAIRFDHHGNTQEEYKDTEEHHEEPAKKKKKPKKPVVEDSDEVERRHDANNRLNEEVVNKQLQIRDLADESSDEHDEEDDIPLITIPMVDILKQYQRMAHGFQSSTEEYSDEMPEKEDHFANPHLQDALHQISAERKVVKREKKEGKKVKPAAQRVFEDLSRSEEEL